MLPHRPRAPFLKEISNGHDPSSPLRCRRGHPTEADWGKLPSNLQGETRSVVNQAYPLHPLPTADIFLNPDTALLSEAARRRSSPETPAQTRRSAPRPPPFLRAAAAVLPWPGRQLPSSAG